MVHISPSSGIRLLEFVEPRPETNTLLQPCCRNLIQKPLVRHRALNRDLSVLTAQNQGFFTQAPALAQVLLGILNSKLGILGLFSCAL